MTASEWRSRIGMTVALAPATFAFAAVLAQQPSPQPAAPQTPGQTANMTGKGGFVDSSDLMVRRIRFEAGARTYWHTHTNAQVIIAEEGVGSYQVQGAAVKTFAPGQPVYLPANVPHWHGAAPDKPVVQATMYAGTIKWGAAVTDDEYAGRKKR